MTSAYQIGWLLAGGITGTVLRYALATFTYRFTSGMFPWGTVAVNLSGCFAIGLLWGAMNTEQLSKEVKNFVFIGLLGAFTTYSTYSLDTLNLFRMGEWKLALANVLVSNIGGIGLTTIGFLIGKMIHSRL